MHGPLVWSAAPIQHLRYNLSGDGVPGIIEKFEKDLQEPLGPYEEALASRHGDARHCWTAFCVSQPPPGNCQFMNAERPLVSLIF